MKSFENIFDSKYYEIERVLYRGIELKENSHDDLFGIQSSYDLMNQFPSVCDLGDPTNFILNRMKLKKDSGVASLL